MTETRLVNGIAVVIEGSDLDELLEERQAYEPPVLVSTILYKSTVIRRLTMNESAEVMNIINGEPAYLQLLYHASEWFEVGDAMVQYLEMLLTEAFGETRAKEIMAF